MALTDTEIKRAKPTDKMYSLSDSGGLRLDVSPSGGKLWRWKYRFEGREKLMALGKYPQVSLSTARKRHTEGRDLLAAGEDPMKQRKGVKIAQDTAKINSFASVTSLWLEHWQEGKSIRHVDSVRRRMSADILPALGSRPIELIEATEIVAMTKLIEQRGAHDIAKRALETTGQVFRYAIAHGFSKRNPAVEIRPSDILNQFARQTTPGLTRRSFRTCSEASRFITGRTSLGLPSTSGSDLCADQRID